MSVPASMLPASERVRAVVDVQVLLPQLPQRLLRDTIVDGQEHETFRRHARESLPRQGRDPREARESHRDARGLTHLPSRHAATSFRSTQPTGNCTRSCSHTKSRAQTASE